MVSELKFPNHFYQAAGILAHLENWLKIMILFQNNRYDSSIRKQNKTKHLSIKKLETT